MSDDKIPEWATMITLFIEQRWDTSTPAQQKAFAYILAVRIDNLRRDINALYDSLNAAADAAQAQRALEIFHRAAQKTAHDSDLDLLSASGEHTPDAQDKRRLDFFQLAHPMRDVTPIDIEELLGEHVVSIDNQFMRSKKTLN